MKKFQTQLEKVKIEFYNSLTPFDIFFKIKGVNKNISLLKRFRSLEKSFNECFDGYGNYVIENIDIYFQKDFLITPVDINTIKTFKEENEDYVLNYIFYNSDNLVTYGDLIYFTNNMEIEIMNAIRFRDRPSIIINKWQITKNIVHCIN